MDLYNRRNVIRENKKSKFLAQRKIKKKNNEEGPVPDLELQALFVGTADNTIKGIKYSGEQENEGVRAYR